MVFFPPRLINEKYNADTIPGKTGRLRSDGKEKASEYKKCITGSKSRLSSENGI